MMRYVAASLLFTTLALEAGTAGATVVVAVTLDEMARECAAAVRGTVVSRRSAWDDQHRRIHSYAEIEVLETLAGSPVAGTRITVRSMGGTVGDVGMNVSGTARFNEGEEVVVFLEPDRLESGRFVVLGMSQGKYQVDRGGEVPMVLRSTAGLAFVTPSKDGSHTVQERISEGRLALDALRTRVRAVRNAEVQTPALPQTPVVPAPPVVPLSPTDPN